MLESAQVGFRHILKQYGVDEAGGKVFENAMAEYMVGNNAEAEKILDAYGNQSVRSAFEEAVKVSRKGG